MQEVHRVSLKGSSFSNEDGSSRQALLSQCRVDQRLVLRPEPDNPHDRHAVAVLDSESRVLGWLPSNARDASDMARGRVVNAYVERIVGGPTMPGQPFDPDRNYGMVIRIEKDPIDWGAFNSFRAIAERTDKMVESALRLAATGSVERAIPALEKALRAVVELNRTNPVASAHRYATAPINKLTTMLVKAGLFQNAIEAFDLWGSVPDPIGIPRAEDAALKTRITRARSKLK